MASENDTLVDIVADFRQYVAHAKIPPEVAETIACYLDRIEAAWKREKAEAEAAALSAGGIVEAARHQPIGNAAAMREALVKIREYIITGNTGYEPKELLELILNWCDSSLTKPPRNCDVGTAEEQEKRFTEVCKANSEDGVRGICSETCPFGRDYQSECALAWAQMKYTEGGAA